MRLCHIDDLPDGDSRGFDPHASGRDTVLLVRQGRSLHGWRNSCPHHGTPMAWRKDAYLNAARDRIVCSAHGAQFEIHTGRCTLGPCLGQALTPVLLSIDNDGGVHLAAIQSEETNP
jgi:nitrite reductase/ring-hydroxylating ferredoxin subunit